MKNGAIVELLRGKSAAGDAAALEELLTEPELDQDASVCMAILDYLGVDRDEISQSMGMGGGLLLPGRIRREVIRSECERQGYTGEMLSDTVDIVKMLDLHLVHETRAKLYEEFREATKPKPKGRG